MTWITTNTGRDHSLSMNAQIQPGLITYQELAHSLAHINRYSGHARRTYSVAEHSLLCQEYAKTTGASALAQLCVLMHDAHEMLIGDVTSPVKAMLGGDWYVFEGAIQRKVLESFSLWDASLDHAKLIKQCDLVALASERAELLEWHPLRNKPWPVLDTPGAEVKPWENARLNANWRQNITPAEWSVSFQRRAVSLRNSIEQGAAA